MDITGQRVIILGGTSGIGLATARGCLEAGAEVIVASRSDEKVRQALAVLGQRATGEAVNATSREELEVFFSRVGAFDHLVLTLSGGEGGGPFRTLDLAKLRSGFTAKFWPQVQAAQESLNTLKSTGSITFVTAISAHAGLENTAGLAAINGALEAMIKPLASELRPLRINAVSPGVIDTSWWDALPHEQREQFFAQTASQTPVGRVGRAEDVAHVILFLLSNSFMTASIIECDGGLRLPITRSRKKE